MITKFEDIIQLKYNMGMPMKKVAVVCAESAHTVEAIILAYEKGLVEPVLIGAVDKVKEMLYQLNCNHPFQIIDADSKEECIAKMQEMVHTSKVGAIMKGMIETKDLMKAVVTDPQFRTDNIICSICFFKIPNYPKLLALLDSGVVMYPNLEQKKGIIKDAVECFHAMGYERPKVAILCSVDVVNPKMPETVDAQELTRMGEDGEFGECSVFGPLSYDLCVDPEAARIKDCQSDVAGDADIIIVPDINTGNALAKALQLSAQADSASMILGTKLPVMVTSRSSRTEEKYWSIIFSCALQ